MALTLDDLYKPVNDFIQDRFQTEASSPVFFRFDKIGSAIDKSDFIDENLADNTNKAREEFSDMVNCMAVEQSDGINIVFSADRIEQAYETLLQAALPFVPPNEPNAEAISQLLVKIKAGALKDMEKISQARNGTITDYFPATGTPENWYDPANNDGWTRYSYEARESVTTHGSEDPRSRLWRLKLDDAALQFLVKKPEEQANPKLFHQRILMRKLEGPLAMARLDQLEEIKPRVQPAAPHTLGKRRRAWIDRGIAGGLRDHRGGLVSEAVTVATSPVLKSFTIQNNLKNVLAGLNLAQRYQVNHFIKDNAPTQPSTTSSVKISFEYCPVRIQRLWLSGSFLNNRSWYIPGRSKGELSKPGGQGSFSALPIGFVAIRNLEIEANWSDVDVTHAKNATDFGPFEVDSEILNNKLSRKGIQVIGWMLQRMPELPPNDPYPVA